MRAAVVCVKPVEPHLSGRERQDGRAGEAGGTPAYTLNPVHLRDLQRI